MSPLSSLIFIGLMASTVLAGVSSTNYLPFQLEKRDCTFSRCDCQRVHCSLDMCFDAKVDPWVLVDSALSPYYGVDCGQFDSWNFTNPAQSCDGGLSKATGQFYINRKLGTLGQPFTANYTNTDAADPNRGSVLAYCRPVQDVACTCHSRYNSTTHDCSASCGN